MRSFCHSAPVRLLGLLLLSVTLFLGGSYAARDDKPANDDKPARDDKAAQGDKPAEDKGGKPEEKDEKKEEKKDDKPPQPFTLRLEIMQLKPKDDDLDKSPPPKKKDTKDQRAQRYVALLKDENLMLRKRAALWLLTQKDYTVRLSVYPALLDLSLNEKDDDLRHMVDEQLNGEQAVYSTPEKVDALLKALDEDSDASPELRQVAYERLGGLYLNKLIDEPLRLLSYTRRERIRAALEGGLLDATPEGQAGAAESLELCDAFDEARTNAIQILTLRPNKEKLKLLGYGEYTADDVAALIRQKYKRIQVRVVDVPVRAGAKGDKTEKAVECSVTPLDRVLILSQVRLPAKTGRRLRELVRVEVAAPEPEKK